MINLSFHPRFVLDDLQHGISTSQECTGVLEVLGCCGFHAPIGGCSYFPEGMLLVYLEVRTYDAILGLSVRILGFPPPPPHYYILKFSLKFVKLDN